MIDELLAEIGQEAEEYLAERPDATLVVGMSVRGERAIRSFRAAGSEHAPEPDESSIYEIGSVSKVLTTTLLAVLEDEGLLSVEDPIRKHLPELRLRDEIGSITLRQLATHSSGLESLGKLHQELIADEVRGTEPPYGAYTHYLRYRKEHLYADLESAELAYPTGQGWIYSIMGMGTLGHILELVTGQPYEALLRERICTPLGLEDTAYTLSADQRDRIAFAYDLEGQPLPNWHHDVLLPQGGLRSTMHDLLAFVEANLRASAELDDARLSKALRRTREVFSERPANLPVDDPAETADFVQGLAWRGLPRPAGHAWWHPGTTLFYLAGAGIDEHAQVGFAVAYAYRKALGDMVTFHTLERDWFDRACRLASTTAEEELNRV